MSRYQFFRLDLTTSLEKSTLFLKSATTWNKASLCSSDSTPLMNLVAR